MVTSNYSINDLFGADYDAKGKQALGRGELVKALLRRFTVIHLDKPYEAEPLPPIAATVEPERVPIEKIVPIGKLNPVHYLAANNKRIAKIADKKAEKERKEAVSFEEIELESEGIDIEALAECISDDHVDQSAEI